MNLIDPEAAEPSAAQSAPVSQPVAAIGTAAERDPRPEYLPEKFWDGEAKSVRTEALAKSYCELERRMRDMVRVPAENAPAEEQAVFRRALGVPDKAEEYRIEARHAWATSDAQVNERLHKAGFTPAQAQLVYDLAAERLGPMVEEMAAAYESRRHLDRLKETFGGESQWQNHARQMDAWGKAHLPPDVYGALASSYEGVMALRRMMEGEEPKMLNEGGPREELSEAELVKLMQDPRYWRDRDPAIFERVSQGFQRLYPGAA